MKESLKLPMDGIVLDKDKLVSIIRGTEMYYDVIMEAVYIDYDAYFEEV